jgi:hypothetical protein
MIIDILILLLCGILIGYNLGRKKGIKEGKRTAERSLPLIFKEISLENGSCIICHGKGEEYKEMLKK